MNVSQVEYKVLKGMTRDLLKFEGCINTIGVETRCGEGKDDFRNFFNILQDVATVVSKNPTLLDDARQTDFKTKDEMMAFLAKYDLSEIEKIS